MFSISHNASTRDSVRTNNDKISCNRHNVLQLRESNCQDVYLDSFASSDFKYCQHRQPSATIIRPLILSDSKSQASEDFQCQRLIFVTRGFNSTKGRTYRSSVDTLLFSSVRQSIIPLSYASRNPGSDRTSFSKLRYTSSFPRMS